MSSDRWREFVLSRTTWESRAASHPFRAHFDGTNSCSNFERVKSNGIDPISFHKKQSNKDLLTPAERQLVEVLRLASKNEILQKRKQHTDLQKVRLEAYHDVTSFKMFPLQDLAMSYLNEMIADHLGRLGSSRKEPSSSSKQTRSQSQMELLNNQQSKLETKPTCWNENKRRKIDELSELNRMKLKYIAEFLREKNYPSSIEKNVKNNPYGNVISEEKNSAEICERQTNNEDICQTVAAKKYEFLPVLWSMEPRVFAVETSSTGKRKYAVGNLGRFFHHYWRKLNPCSRHYYELIREGTPCRLYFGAYSSFPMPLYSDILALC